MVGCRKVFGQGNPRLAAEGWRSVHGDLGDVQWWVRESASTAARRRTVEAWEVNPLPAMRTRHASASFPKDRLVVVAPRRVAGGCVVYRWCQSHEATALQSASTNCGVAPRGVPVWSSRGMGNKRPHAELQCGCRTNIRCLILTARGRVRRFETGMQSGRSLVVRRFTLGHQCEFCR